MNALAKCIAWITRKFHPRGTQRVLKLLFNPERTHISTIIPYNRTQKIHVNTATYVEWELFFFGSYEKHSLDLIKRLVKEGDVVIDAGAHIGTHTLVLSKEAGERGRVIAFDPERESCKRLRENIVLNQCENVSIVNAGLSDKEGKMTLYLWSKEMINHGTASFYDLPKLEKTGYEVDVHTIDSYVSKEELSRLNFIKINTRGSDFPIILGGRSSIEKMRPCVLFEYNRENWQRAGASWEEMVSVFDNISYLLYCVEDKGIGRVHQEPKKVTSWNILAVPAEHEEKVQNLFT